MDRISRLNQTVYDLIVIGGGSLGAGIARDAALRGLKILLVEKGDFGSGTSSRTSKIVHGGIRYLEQGEFGLVFESLRERFILQKIAPHLVYPLPFLIPVYQNGPRPLWMIRAGLWLYDLLSLFKNKERYRVIKREEVLKLLPTIQPEGLVGGGVYYDSQMNDARLVLENILDAKSHGAEVLNYVEVDRFLSDGRRLTGILVTDHLEERSVEVKGKYFVNAGGPWAAEVARLGGEKGASRIRMTQGTHIIVPQLSKEYAIVVSPKEEKRIFFIIPWHGNSLIGTTDIDYKGDPGDVSPKQEEIEYLLGETRKIFPSLSLKKEEIISVFSGVRPLLDEQGIHPSEVTRRAKIDESISGMISITGGKYTTFRSTAEKVVDLVGKRLARTDLKSCSTSIEPLYGGRFKHSFETCLKENGPRWADSYRLDLSIVFHLIRQYGNRATEIMDLVEKERSLGEKISPTFPNIKAELIYAIEKEMALTLSDFLRRRTLLGLGGMASKEDLGKICEIMGKKLGWDNKRFDQEINNYFKEIFIAEEGGSNR